MIFIFVIILIALIFISVWWFNRVKCPNCHKRKSERVSEKKLRTETIYFKETETIKEYENTSGSLTGYSATHTSRPNRVSTREITIPGERIWYQVEYKCKNCGNTFARKEYVDKKPTIK